MENASKALLMAGGVLIVILIASLGVYFSKNIAGYTSNVYKQLEDSQRTEFNQQFLNYNGKSDLTIQDIVTIINLAKDSNIKNELEDGNAPSDPSNDKSLYVTVEFVNTSYYLGSTNPTVKYLTPLQCKNLEKLQSETINIIINNEMSRNEIQKFSCEVHTNKNTQYVNYIVIK